MNRTVLRKYVLQITLGCKRYRKGTAMSASLNNKIA